ncbi:MAG: aminotransferase class IV, partial [Nanoarchaeota archaeon]|nr:aminotransferase class IV [Nanoarchaeota archaeon]
MVNPGIIYRQDTMGNKGLFTLEDMAREGMLLTPYSHVVHYANSVFEGIRAVWDKDREKLYLITLEEHVNRFLGSIKSKFHGNFNKMDSYSSMYDYLDDIKFSITPPKFNNDFKFLELTDKDIRDAIIDTVKANIEAGNIDPEQGCYVRPIVYRDQIFDEDSKFDPSLGVFSLKHNVVFEIEAFTWGNYLEGNPKVIVYPEGIDTPLRHIKAGGNYAFGGMVKDWAVSRGYSEALLTDISPERNVLEGGGENLFVYLS